MQHATVKKFSWWLAWQHEREERWLGDLSRQGLHLTRSLPFVSTFALDPSVRFVYRLDYQPDISGQKRFQEYLDMYADAGWEYQCSLNAWHYFRRPWQPGVEPELYTDRASLAQLYTRIQRVLGVVGLANLVIFVANLSNFHRMGELRIPDPFMAVHLVLVCLLGYGFLRLQNRVRALNRGMDQ